LSVKDVEEGFVVRTPKLKPKKVKAQHKPLKASFAAVPKPNLVGVKRRASRAKRHLATPIGKVAAVNSLALLALFAFVIQHQSPAEDASLTRDVGAAAQQSIRQYQPRVGMEAKSVVAFSEAAAAEERKLPLYTWVTPWNLDSVKANLASYKGLSAFWVTVGEDGSTLSAKGNWAGWEELMTQRKEGQSTSITVTGDPDFTYLTLSSTTAQQAFISNIVTLLQEKNAGGVDVDFEALGSENRELFTAFVRNLTAALKPLHKEVIITVEARIGNAVPMDWRNLGQIADEIRIMTYDYHARTTGAPGPVAPLGWVKEVVDYAISQVDPAKVVIGLGNYGYNWASPATADASWQGIGLSFERATSLAAELEVPILKATGIDERGYDIGTIPYFTYTDTTDSTPHSVWFEDSVSLEEKVALLSQYPLKGVVFWSVGIGDNQFWINRQPTSPTP
jgi:spore germination protein